MQVWLNYLLVVALAVMVGVSISVNQSSLQRARVQSYLDDHSQISSDVAEALFKGTLAEGMTPEQVLISWGAPDSVKVVANRADLELWAYPKAMALFERGTLTRWVTARSKFDRGNDLIRRVVYLMANDVLDPRTAELIGNGQIAEGMTSEQVEASWGQPQDVLPIYDENTGEFTIWVYPRGHNGHTHVTFQADQVVGWADLPQAQTAQDDAKP